MYQSAEGKAINKALEKNAGNKLFWLPFSISILAAAMVLIGVFGLSSWAEASGLNHGLQHVLIFLGGVGFGGSLLTMYKAKRG